MQIGKRPLLELKCLSSRVLLVDFDRPVSFSSRKMSEFCSGVGAHSTPGMIQIIPKYLGIHVHSKLVNLVLTDSKQIGLIKFGNNFYFMTREKQTDTCPNLVGGWAYAFFVDKEDGIR